MITQTAPLTRPSRYFSRHSLRQSARQFSRAALRTSHFELRTELLLTLIVMALLILAQTARAESFEVCTGANATWNCLAQNETKPAAASAPTSAAGTTTTTTVTTTTTSGPAPAVPAAPAAANATVRAEAPKPLENDFIITTTFGSKATSGTAGCKTAALVENTVRDLKVQCNNWLKERKTELKNKFHTGTCQETCSDCGMSLQRCNVTGTVHYSK